MMFRTCHLRCVILAAALAGAASASIAQSAATEESGAGNLGGLFSGIGKSVGGLFDGGTEQPLIASLKPGPYTISNEAIGDELDVETRRVENYGLVPIKAYQDYANAIYSRLKDLSGVTNVPGSVYLMATSELDATSSADGNVFLSMAWVNTITSEDELAALLAHELSHVLLHHHDSTIISNAQKKLQFAFATGAGLMNSLDKLGQSGGASLTPGQVKALKRMQVLVGLTDKVMLPAWTRSQEADADRMAADLLHKAGYSAAGMTDFLNDISSWDQKQAERRKQVEAQIQEQMQALTSSGSLDGALKLGLDEAAKGFMESLSSKHESGEKRLEDLTAYREKHYPEWPRTQIRKDAYSQIMNDRTVKPIRDVYQAAFSAMAHIDRGRHDDAYKLLAPVTRQGMPGAAHAMPQFQLYRAMEELGRKDARTQLARSYHAAEPAWTPYAEAIRIEAKQGNRTTALQIVQEARKRFKDAPALTPRLVGVYAELGFDRELQQEMITCNATHVTYREQCQQSSKRK